MVESKYTADNNPDQIKDKIQKLFLAATDVENDLFPDQRKQLHKKVIALCEQINNCPSVWDAKLLFMKGCAYFKLKQYDNAATCLGMASELEPTNQDYLRWTVRVLEKKNSLSRRITHTLQSFWSRSADDKKSIPEPLAVTIPSVSTSSPGMFSPSLPQPAIFKTTPYVLETKEDSKQPKNKTKEEKSFKESFKEVELVSYWKTAETVTKQVTPLQVSVQNLTDKNTRVVNSLDGEPPYSPTPTTARRTS